MKGKKRIYVAIDLKSFYASVECLERNLNPLTTHLVVADNSRTEKTICLAVTPSLKKLGISGRARLFEVVQQVKYANNQRLYAKSIKKFQGSSCLEEELVANQLLEVDYIVAPPRMALYTEYSARIFKRYMEYVSEEDVHIYSIDEVFIDITNYLQVSNRSPYDFVKQMIQDVYKTVGITATAGIGTNLYLCKIAMDIMAKKTPPDREGVCIAYLDERSYREQLWAHQPITDFWRVGRGYEKKLNEQGMYTMGDVARCSIDNEDLLYRLFGVNAELLIDHAWGVEPCTLEEIKSYEPESQSTGIGQVLHSPYSWEKARVIVQEMVDMLVLDLVSKRLVTDQIVLTVGYDIINLTTPEIREKYKGEVKVDAYGRKIPKHAHGTITLPNKTASTALIMEAVLGLFDRIVLPFLFVRRVNIVANNIMDEKKAKEESGCEQLSLFELDGTQGQDEKQQPFLEKEKKLQQAVLNIKKKYGKNAILKGMNLQEGATAQERNQQIGGHKA